MNYMTKQKLESTFWKMNTINRNLSYAIPVIKKDQNGKPAPAKYRIVVLKNLDSKSWTNSECFAPIMSQLDSRLRMDLACQL